MQGHRLATTIAFARRETHVPARGRKWTAADESNNWSDMCKIASARPHASFGDIAHSILETAIAHALNTPNRKNNFDRGLFRRLSSERNLIADPTVRQSVTLEIKKIQHRARRRRAVAELQAQLEHTASRPLPRTRAPGLASLVSKTLDVGPPPPEAVGQRREADNLHPSVCGAHPSFEERRPRSATPCQEQLRRYGRSPSQHAQKLPRGGHGVDRQGLHGALQTDGRQRGTGPLRADHTAPKKSDRNTRNTSVPFASFRCCKKFSTGC